MKEDHDSFMAENKNTKWSSLSEEQINFYIRKYNLTDDADFMNSLHAMSDGSYNGVADADKKAEGDGRQLPQLKNAFTLSRRPTISY